jgi:O-antigen ligase
MLKENNPYYSPVIRSQLKSVRYWLICLALSVATALPLFWASTLGKKWLVAVCVGYIGIFGCFILQNNLKSVSLMLAAFLIPLRIDFYIIYKQTYFSPTSYPGFPVTAFDIILVILVSYWALQILRGEEKFLFFPSISVPAITYILLSGISAFQSTDRELSIALLILMIKSYIAFLYFANRIKEKFDISLVIFAICLGVLLQSVVGGIQYLFGGAFEGIFGIPKTATQTKLQGEFILSRVGGTIGHPNALGRYLCLCIPVLLTYPLAQLDSRLAKLTWVSLATGGITLILTLSRGSWAALALVSLFLFFEIFRRYLKSRAKSMVIVFLVVGFIATAILVIFEDVRIRLFENEYRSAQSRIPMAKVALNVIAENPIKGVGLNNYSRVMQRYDRTREWQTYGFPHPVHNSYLLIAAESGIPVLIAFLWLITAVFAKGWSALKCTNVPLSLLQVGWMGGIMTWLISAMFDRDFPGANVMIWFTIAMIVATSRMLSSEA